jgi:hypothetical protein
MRSGSANDDYIEEPLIELAKPLAPMLELSNQMLTVLHDGDAHKFYTQYVAPELAKTMKLEDLERVLRQANAAAGKPVSFKPQQWAFAAHSDASGNFIASTKIMTHEGGTVYYTFTFHERGDTKIVGLHIRPRSSTGPYPL